MEAKKFDQEKPRMDLIDGGTLVQLAEILTFGADKYGAYNWRAGMAWSRCFAALQRHMLAWWSGESTDPETGKSHLAHAMCNLQFLMTYEREGLGEDDRYRKETT